MRALAAALGWELVTPPTANRLKPWPLNRAAYRARNAIERYSVASSPYAASPAGITNSPTSTSTRSSSPAYTS